MTRVAETKACETCSETYRPRSNRQRWCSQECIPDRRPSIPCRNPACDRTTRNGRDCSRCAARLWRWGTYEQATWKIKKPIVGKDGYTRVHVGLEHPDSNAQGYVYLHRLVMAEVIGRSLYPEETVHHRNGVKTDNDPSNLELWAKAHGSGQRIEDLVAHVVDRYRDLVVARLAHQDAVSPVT
jgi:hypothetical protein